MSISQSARGGNRIRKLYTDRGGKGSRPGLLLVLRRAGGGAAAGPRRLLRSGIAGDEAGAHLHLFMPLAVLPPADDEALAVGALDLLLAGVGQRNDLPIAPRAIRGRRGLGG